MKELKKGKEIAKMTGLSQTAISRIYTGKGNVSDDQCKKVLGTK